MDYTLKIRKFTWWWLLVFLPLILLIPIKRDIKFKVINSYDNSVVTGLKVDFQYTKRDLFNFETYKFFTRDYLHGGAPYTSDTTDENGIAVMKDVKYTLYQWVFRNKDSTRTSAISKCTSLDTTINLFDLKKLNTVYMSVYLKDIEFTVIDAADNLPLPNALVTIKSDKYNYLDSMRSQPDGKVIFRNVPFCSNIEVEGYKYGWYRDSISGKFEDHQGDTLRLKPKMDIIKFYAKDLHTKKPLVGARGTIVANPGSPTTIQTGIITNTSGVGKGVGVSDSVRIINKIRIDVTHQPYYNDSSTVQFHKVEDWIDYTEEQQTIYLRPNPNPILFKNVDCETGAPLEGVVNTITIRKSDGTTKVDSVTSSVDGEFGFSAGMGDKISIVARSNNICPNEYLINDSTIRDAGFGMLKSDANKRIIPLCKKPAPIDTFRIVDADNPSVGIEGAKYTVIADGTQVGSGTSGPDGKFIVDNVHPCQKISIIADGSPVDYGMNDTKIKDKDYKDIMSPNPQNLRTIPLEINPLKVKFCDVNKNDSTVISGATNEIYVNGNLVDTKSGGCFEVEAKPDDKIKIVGKYDGQVNDTKVDGSKTLQELEAGSQNDRNIPFEISPPPPPPNPCSGGTAEDEDISIGGGSYKQDYYMGKSSGTFKFTFYTDTKADRIIVWCNGKKLMDEDIATGGDEVNDWEHRFLEFDDEVITVEVIGTSNWKFIVNCP